MKELRMRGTGTIVIAAAVVVSWMLAGGALAQEHQYIGAKKCGMCHKKADIGDQYGKWQKSPHAKAFETLKGAKAVEIAKQKGLAKPPSEAGECLRCHATAFGLKESQLYRGQPLEVADGVQCESCHGPGSDYKNMKTMKDQAMAVAAGLRLPGKDPKICTTCHNSESPTWDAAKGFDFAKRKEQIAHPIPKK